MKEKKGLTLQVLVTTIIIILILVTIIIFNFVNITPIDNSREAKFKTNVDQYNSQLSLVLSKKFSDDNSFQIELFDLGPWNGTEDNIKGTVKEYIPIITKEEGSKFEVVDGKLVYIGEDEKEKEWTSEVNSNGQFGVGVIATYNRTISGEAAYNNPIIPEGFMAKNTDDANWDELSTDWNDGLVIEDANGNQFVWVPVDEEDVSYEKWCVSGVSYLDTTDGKLPSGVINESDQISLYGGFYISRYEAGNESNVLVSKQGMTTWTDITYAQSKSKAESMYNTSEVKSGLITGTQWDTVMKWIDITDKNVTDSRTWGNYSDSQSPANIGVNGSIQVTGYSEYWKAKNIYDLAGNKIEWTNETYGSNSIARGGDIAAAYRDGGYSNNVASNLTFRVVLYVLCEDNVGPVNSTMSASPTSWTNGNVTVTITYPEDATVKEYSTDSETWSAYTAPITVNTNGMTVYARAEDMAGNLGGTATITISNIDKVLPTVTYGTDGGKDLQTASTTVKVSDEGGSTLDISTLQYVWDTKNTSVPISGWSVFTNEDTITKTDVNGTYYLWIKAVDNAGNIIITKSSPFIIGNTSSGNPIIVASPTLWTNGNVLVTITYPSDSVSKEYNTNNTAWSTYVDGVVVYANGTTVYARAIDKLGKQSETVQLTVSNIDKILPTVTFGTDGGKDLQTASTTVTVSDSGGSNLNSNNLKYAWSSQNITEPDSGWEMFTNGAIITKKGVTGTYYLWIKALDNAGNSITAKSNSFVMDNTVPENPTMTVSPTSLTNSDVLVIITYSADAAVKEYSINGTSWNIYTAPISISTNNIAVYARAKDAVGNQSGTVTMTITNIDKVSPTVEYGTNGSSGVKTASTTVTVSDAGGSSLNTSTLQYVWDIQNISEPGSGWTTFMSGDTITKTGVTGTYYLWVKASDSLGNSITTKSSSFVIDNTVPEDPVIILSQTSWTNGDVTATITYPFDANVKEYSTDASTWSIYTEPIVVSTNGTTVYARTIDAAGNQSGTVTNVITNIDKSLPTVTYETNGGTDLQSASTVVTISDIGGSSLNESTLQYVWDTQNITIPISGWVTFTNRDTITKTGVTGTYYLWVKATDNAGNIITTKSNSFVMDNTVPDNPTMIANPTGWTNNDVLVTITYPPDTAVKEYSTNGTLWNTYTVPVAISTNGTTVYAMAKDGVGNQSGTATMTITNIDKLSPVVEYEADGGTNLQAASIVVTVSDVGESNLNASTLQYVWDTQNIVEPSSGWLTFASGDTITKTGVTGTYYLWTKAADNANNSVITKSNPFVIDSIPPEDPIMVANPTSLTNGDVAVTITYPPDATVKEYSINGVVWNTYIDPVAISTNNTSIYSRATDEVGNQSNVAIMTITNIDKVSPTVSYGTNGSGSVKVASTTVTVSDTGVSGLNAGSLQYVWDTQNITTPVSGWLTFTNGDTITKTGVTGTYYLWIKGSDNVGNNVISKTNEFVIDNTAPTDPTMIINPTGWTNGDVLVTITYPLDATVKEYSTNGTMWNAYTVPVAVSTNGTTMYAKATDASENQSGTVTKVITNIDKVLPTVEYGTNGSSGLKTASTTVTVSDAGGSSLNTSNLQYIWDTQNTLVPSSGWTVFTNGDTITKTGVTGTYYLWIKAVDNAGNSVTTKSNSFVIDNTVPTDPTMVENPTGWTNGDVLVTITYPLDATVKEYSTNGTTWNAYTVPVVVSTNGTTVYAKATDEVGNQSNASTINITNIDKVLPTVEYGTNGSGGVKTASTTVTVSDTGGSSLNTSTLQYVWDTQNITVPSSGWLTFTNEDTITKTGVTGTYYLWVKAVDNAGNNIASKSNVFTIDNTLPEDPTMVASPTGWTNGDVQVTITYPSDAVVKEYSTNGTSWNAYTVPVVVSAHGTKVYARSEDAVGNQSATVTMTIINIDKVSPTVSYGTDGSSDVKVASTTITVSDGGRSSLNEGTLQYVWDTQNITTPGSGWSVFTNGDTITKTGVTGTYYLWVKAEDNAGNSITTKSSSFVIDNTAPENPTMVANPTGWTNGNVLVTITYSGDTAIKEYSLNGTTWNTYTVPIAISTNNTSIYSRATDEVGNQSGTETMTITNIDKVSPTVAYGTNGASNVQIASTIVTVSDTGVSGLNVGSLQYVWDTQNITAPVAGWTVFTNADTITKTGVTGTYYLWIKAVDNAGNSITAKSSSFVIDNTAPTNPKMVVNPTGWTNGNVLVTITYSVDSAVKEYSTDGISWNTYTVPVSVSTNGTTVYAKATDDVGNESETVISTINNIDKVSPTVSYGTNGAPNVQTASTIVTVSDAGGSSLSASTLQYVWDTQNTLVPSSGWTVFTNEDTITKTGVTGTYYLWIKALDNAGNGVTTKSNSFVIDNTVPTEPTMVESPTGWTNGDVLVTITYPLDATVKEYSTNGTTWNAYTVPVVVSTNGTTVYAKATDEVGNQSNASTINITNIDKVLPTVEYGTNGSGGVKTASTTVTVGDTGGSNLNTSSLQYMWDTQNITTPSSGWTEFTSGDVITKTGVTGTYYLWVKAVDNAGNNIITKSNSFVIDNIVPTDPTMVENPTGWTNNDVLVTITYPVDAIVKEYSTNGTSWNTYMEPVAVSTNGITVYARATDAAENQSGTTIMTITNIDKILPTVIYGTNGASDIKIASTTVTVGDAGGSSLNESTLQYVWDTQNITTPGSGWASFTNGDTITKTGVTGIYYLWVKAVDNAGNSIIAKSSSFVIDNTAPENPTLVANPAGWTNENVLVTISYSADTAIKEYSLDGTSWSMYTTEIVVGTNGITVYARATDTAENTSETSAITINNIDKVSPTVGYVIVGGENSQTANAIVIVSDAGGSSINESTLQYVWDTQNITEPSSGWEPYINNTVVSKTDVTGTYYLWIKGADNAGNTVVSKTNAFVIDNTAPTNPIISASPLTWTNLDVMVTITYSEDTTVKEYSLDGTSWSTYVEEIPVRTNNTTVYARGRDAAENQSGQSSLTVANIDNVLPTVAYGTNGASNVQTASTVVTVSDMGGSGLNSSTLQYVWSTESVIVPASGWATFTNGTTLSKTGVTGTYYLWIKASDVAGNSSISKTNAFTFVTYNTINGLPPSYNNPIIPTGFSTLTTSDASWSSVSTDWDKGLVVQDVSGNQFVWVPVDGTAVSYEKWCTTGLPYNDPNISIDPIVYGTVDEYDQINNYGGFYISRYEAGNVSGTLVSKKGVNVWTNINYYDAMYQAENMYTTDQVKSGLVTGTQWDTTMKWIKNSGKNVTDDSTAWGNYSNSPVSGHGVKQVTGYSDSWKAKNIYDLAGNTLEWTNEAFISNRITRGGFYTWSGSDYPAACRNVNPADNVLNNLSFRVVLYVM